MWKMDEPLFPFQLIRLEPRVGWDGRERDDLQIQKPHTHKTRQTDGSADADSLVQTKECDQRMDAVDGLECLLSADGRTCA